MTAVNCCIKSWQLSINSSAEPSGAQNVSGRANWVDFERAIIRYENKLSGSLSHSVKYYLKSIVIWFIRIRKCHGTREYRAGDSGESDGFESSGASWPWCVEVICFILMMISWNEKYRESLRITISIFVTMERVHLQSLDGATLSLLRSCTLRRLNGIQNLCDCYAIGVYVF